MFCFDRATKLINRIIEFLNETNCINLSATVSRYDVLIKDVWPQTTVIAASIDSAALTSSLISG